MSNHPRKLSHGCHLKKLSHSGVTEYFISALVEEGDSPATMFESMDACLRKLGSPCVLRMDVLGRVNTMGTESLQQKYCYHCADCALNHTRPEAEGVCPVGGVYVHAVEGGSVKPIWLGGQLIGNLFEDRYIRYVSLDNLLPDSCLERPKQAQQVFERMEDALKGAGLSFSHVVRTWLYLNEILDWYDEFNQARDGFFKSRRVKDGLIPCSTGIGGANTNGTAIQASVLAADPLSDAVTIQAIPSPLQCPALDYGSSFSRAVEIRTPEIQRLYVSGTASIDQEGPTRYPDDVDKQIAYTLQVVEAILSSRNLDWMDVNRAVAYFKFRDDFDRFKDYCQQNDLSHLPVGLTQMDVCRDDLLFEIELDAVKVV